MDTLNSGTKLINKSDIRRALPVKGPLGSLIASCAMSLLGLNRINRLYPQFGAYRGREFTKEAMKTFRISTDILPEEVEYIPREGPFIIVSNHPFGGWDGIVLYNTVAAVRPDFRILTNFILSLIPNLRDSFLAVNPFSDRKQLRSSLPGLKAAMETIERGGCVGIFPAGEVSTYYRGNKFPADKEWTHTVMKLVTTCRVPVLRRSGGTVTMRIGRIIPAGEIAKWQDPKELGRMLRSRVYAMEANVPSNQPRQQTAASQEPLLPPVSTSILRKEMEALTPLFEASKFQCFLADTAQIPYMMQEIGRRREESFRQVGEGTGSSIDTDSFDVYYKHLILWDKEAGQLAGAYRLGIGREIYERYGVKGFYTHTLFRYSERFTALLPECIELGRSFLSVEYKKEALPLMLLIKGLFYTVLKYKDCKYLFGPASITSWLPPFYRSMLVYWLEHSASGPHKGLTVPRTPFRYEWLRVDPDMLLSGKTGSVDAFDKYIQRLSDGRFRIPTLIKKYVKLQAEILAFNVDREFNYCVDGMIFLDMAAVPRSEIEMLTKGSKDPEGLIEKFYGTGS